MSFLSSVFFIGIGFVLGCLIAIVGTLQREVEEAKQNGHRR